MLILSHVSERGDSFIIFLGHRKLAQTQRNSVVWFVCVCIRAWRICVFLFQSVCSTCLCVPAERWQHYGNAYCLTQEHRSGNDVTLWHHHRTQNWVAEGSDIRQPFRGEHAGSGPAASAAVKYSVAAALESSPPRSLSRSPWNPSHSDLLLSSIAA